MARFRQDRDGNYFLIAKDILPEAIKKTIKVKAMLKRGDARTINEAVERMDLSRSAYYKYKDYVFALDEASQSRTATLELSIEDKAGVLANVLDKISMMGGSVVSLQQGIPLQTIANAFITVETIELNGTISDLIEGIKTIDGVKRIQISGIG